MHPSDQWTLDRTEAEEYFAAVAVELRSSWPPPVLALTPGEYTDYPAGAPPITYSLLGDDYVGEWVMASGRPPGPGETPHYARIRLLGVRTAIEGRPVTRAPAILTVYTSPRHTEPGTTALDGLGMFQ